MKYSQIITADVANGPGFRTSLFVSGCTHHCEGCFNQETWDFRYGLEFADEAQAEILDTLKEPYIDGLTILGGEPMEPSNQRALVPMLRDIRAQLPQKSIWVYSGYTFEELTGDVRSRCRCEATDEFLSLINVLVDGEFVLGQKDISLKFRGSRNQRILSIPQSLLSHHPTWLSKYQP